MCFQQTMMTPKRFQRILGVAAKGSWGLGMDGKNEGQKTKVTTRMLHSRVKARGNGDSRNYGLKDPHLRVYIYTIYHIPYVL